MAIPTETIDPNALQPHPENYNAHPENQIGELEASYDKFAQFKNIVVWSPSEVIALEDGRQLHPEEKYILAGHGFWQAALRAGATAIEVKDYSGIPYEDALLLMQVDNAAPLGAQPDAGKLAALMEKTRGLAADNPKLGAMLRKLGESAGVAGNGDGEGGGDAEPQIDRAAELAQEWGTQLGQLWQLGEHRLVVGDCTDKAAVEAVTENDIISLCVTSPPYPGADMWTEDGEDKGAQIVRLMQLSKNVLKHLWGLLSEGGIVCWNVQDVPWGNHGVITTTATTTVAVQEIGYSIRGNIIWDKGVPHLPLPWNMRRPCVPNMTHEHILVLFKGDWKPREKKSGLNDQEKTWLAYGVWKISTESAKSIGHKAPFPVELPERCIALFSLQSEIVYDPFAGSGTTIIAAHNLGRIARAIEIDPGYAAVTLQRFKDHTGIEPELLDTLTT